MEYRTPEEMNYFASDLNKYAHSFEPHKMTVNNIDCLVLKRAKKIMRIIESKHVGEKLPWEQPWNEQTEHEVLFKLAKCVPADGTLEVWVIQTSFPFETASAWQYKTGDMQGITDARKYIPKQRIELNKEQLRNFLEVE